MKPFIITTPIPYTNASPHLGHLLEAVYNDSLARYFRRRFDGNVNLTMGLDQHGTKIYETAIKNGVDPKGFVDKTGQIFVDLWEEYEVRYDSWIPTSSLEHSIVSQIFWEQLVKKDLIYKKKYEGLYCIGCESFKTDTELNKEHQCPLHAGKELVQMSENNYFFKLSKFSDRILTYLQKTDIKPEGSRTEWLNFVKEGLQDISISREKAKMPWGVAVPNDEDQVMYVWFEAVINYATAQVNLETIDRYKELPKQRDAVADEILTEIKEAFPVDIMYAGNEISKFHLVFWPAMLMALDIEPPVRALIHGMINDPSGHKFSKSLGNGVYPSDLKELIGVDGTRFALLYNVNPIGDTKFDLSVIKDSYNSHLANNLGNLLMRVTTLIEKNFDGVVDFEKANKIWDEKKVFEVLEKDLSPRNAIEKILEAGRVGNELLEHKQPWKLIKDQSTAEEARQLLTDLSQLLKQIGESLSIFLPESGHQIYSIITAEKITKPEPLFIKVE